MKCLLIVVTLFLLGCAHVISEGLRQKVDKELTPIELFKDPELHKGKIIMLGGIIISSMNTAEGTYIEVLQSPIDYRGRPDDRDRSHGRFIIFHEGYLDTAIYSSGREITVAGEVMGKRVRPLGEIEYSYPVIKAVEIHLFKPPSGIPIRFGIEIWKTF